MFGPVSDILPDIFVIYLDGEVGKVAELHYDQDNSDLNSKKKRCTV